MRIVFLEVALHPAVWSGGGLVKRRKTRVSAWEFAWVPGPVGLWRHGSVVDLVLKLVVLMLVSGRILSDSW